LPATIRGRRRGRVYTHIEAMLSPICPRTLRRLSLSPVRCSHMQQFTIQQQVHSVRSNQRSRISARATSITTRQVRGEVYTARPMGTCIALRRTSAARRMLLADGSSIFPSRQCPIDMMYQYRQKVHRFHHELLKNRRAGRVAVIGAAGLPQEPHRTAFREIRAHHEPPFAPSESPSCLRRTFGISSRGPAG
jgi:hypothetical protein